MEMPPIVPADYEAYERLRKLIDEINEDTFYGKLDKLKRVWREWLLSVYHDIVDPLW